MLEWEELAELMWPSLLGSEKVPGVLTHTHTKGYEPGEAEAHPK